MAGFWVVLPLRGFLSWDLGPSLIQNDLTLRPVPYPHLRRPLIQIQSQFVVPGRPVFCCRTPFNLIQVSSLSQSVPFLLRNVARPTPPADPKGSQEAIRSVHGDPLQLPPTLQGPLLGPCCLTHPSVGSLPDPRHGQRPLPYLLSNHPAHLTQDASLLGRFQPHCPTSSRSDAP